ncbi:MAG: hypothetical protein AAGF49_12845 [Pseudomonadota bacterium]
MTRLRSLIIVLCASAATISATTVFVMKKDAEQTARAIGELNRKISAEKQRISELQAEWSALNHPARLQVLVERHNEVLGLEPIRAEQLSSVRTILAAVERRRAEMEAEMADGIEDGIEAGEGRSE